jgi:PEGA domain
MNLAVAGSFPPQAQPLFIDGLGERRQILGSRGEPLDVLRLSSALNEVPGVEFLLRERANRLDTFRHDAFVPVRGIDVDEPTGTLLVLSEHVAGVRLSALLAAAEKRSIAPDIDAVRSLLRQVVRAMATWRVAMRDVAHGAIGPERILITPAGRVVITDTVFGSALEQLRYPRDRYWTDLRVGLPPTRAVPDFDVRTDVAQVGLVALALVLGRRLTSDVYPGGLAEAVANAALRSGNGPIAPLPIAFRQWILRATQLESRGAFPSADEASIALEDAIGKEHAGAETDAFHVFQARCLALDMRAPATGLDEFEISENSTVDLVGDDIAQDVDLTPRIDALRAFLARYPEQSAAATLVTPVVVPPSTPPVTESAAAESLDPPSAPAATTAAPAPHFFDEPPVRFSPEIPFAPDTSHRRGAAAASGGWVRYARIGGLAAIAIALLVVLLFASGLFGRAATTGVLSVTTTPVGIPVAVDGTQRGVTPVGIELPAGDHVLELQTGRGTRRIPVTITAGGQNSQVLELAAPPAPTPTHGELQVRTEPPSASVTVDGRSVGRSPVSVSDLAPGPHTVVLASEAGTVTERVVIEPGRIASLLVPLTQRAPSSAAGWISVTTPADVQVFEGDRLLGTNQIDRIMLPVGKHEIDLVNEPLGFRERRSVQVTAGQVAPIRPQWPSGTIAINAVPWAEVFVDGNPAGETPIGSVQVPVGVHEILLRHPQLGERRTRVTVTAGAPAKVGVDLRTK